jgi:hypothetical protein
MTGLLLILLFFYGIYIFMILLIGIGTMDYWGYKWLFVMDLCIPFYRLIREGCRAIFKKE